MSSAEGEDRITEEGEKFLRASDNKDAEGVLFNGRRKKLPKRLKTSIQSKVKKWKSGQFWLSKFPFVGFARNYRRKWVMWDVVAGVAATLAVIPQAMGFALVAGLPLQFGLYASIVPGFVYAILGTCPEVTIGPTAVNSVLSLDYAGSNVVRAITLAFFAGLIELAVGMLNLGFLINFISAPVISAFTSAVSIQVMTTQVKGLLGLQVPGKGFIGTWKSVVVHMDKIRASDAALGFSCIGILLFLRKIKDYRWFEGSDADSSRAKFVAGLKWLISVSRNCIVITLAAAVTFVLVDIKQFRDAFIVSNDVEGGLPTFKLPWNRNGSDDGGVVDPLEVADDLGFDLVVVALVSILQHLAVVKIYAPSPSTKVAASQEITALGACQLLGSFVGSMPVTASSGRSSINAEAGVKTPFSGLISGLIILTFCAFLTPYFLAYIPTAALSAVVICSLVFTLDIDILLPIWRSKKSDLIPYALTFVTGLLVNVETGLIAGTLAHLALLINGASSPNLSVGEAQVEGQQYLIITPDRALYFPAVDRVKTFLASNSSNALIPIVVDMSKVVEMDFTAAASLRALTKRLKKSGQTLYFCSLKDEIEEILQGADSALFITYVNLQDAEQKIKALS